MPLVAENRSRESWSAVVLIICSVLMAWRMFSFISDYAVNLLYWDLWDIYPVIFSDGTWWETVRYQVGKTRQGPAFLLTRLIADFTSMNTRAESFAIGGMLCLSLGLAVSLKLLITRRFHLTDAILPLIVLTTVQQDTWVGVPNLAVSVTPLLLLLSICLAWFIPQVALRVSAVVLMNFILINSGYGLVAAPIMPALFTATLLQKFRKGETRDAIWAGVGLVGSLAAVALFLHGLIIDLAGDCSIAGSLEMFYLPGFLVLMFGKFVGLDFDHFGLISTLVGTFLFFAMLEAFVRHGRRLLASEDLNTRVNRVIFVLIGFSLLYTFLTAYGRICVSLLSSQSSRYMTLLIPGFLGLYIDLITRLEMKWRRTAMVALLAGAVLGAFSVDLVTDDGAARIRDSKARWKSCYLQKEDVLGCDEETRFPMFPREPEAFLPPKLEYLKANRLNLFAVDQGWFRFLQDPATRAGVPSPETWILEACSSRVVEVLPLDVSVILPLDRLPASFAGDPADRIIVATARSSGLDLATQDERIRRSDLVRVWSP